MKNFFVRDNSLRNKATNHLYRLIMNFRTEVYEVRDPSFSANFFSFKPFGEIASNENEEQGSFFGITSIISFV